MRPRAGSLVPLETVFVKGVTRGATAHRRRGLLTDLTGGHVHAIVYVRRFGATTAATLAATAVAVFSAAVATGAAANALTLLRGADP